VRLSALVETSNGGLRPVRPLATDPEVRAVVTTDLLDPGRYLGGGELVLTGLVWWRADEPRRSHRFVAALAGAGAAALAAGEAQLGSIPLDLVQACAEAGLPLLRVPVAVSFASVTDHVSRSLSGADRDDLLAALARHRAMVAAVADREAGRSGLPAVLAMVSAGLGLDCWVLAPNGALVAGSTALDPAVGQSLTRPYLRSARLPVIVPRTGGRTVSLFGDAATDRAAGWVLAVEGDHRQWPADRSAAVLELAGLVAAERGLGLRRTDAEGRLAAALAGTDGHEVELAAGRCGLDPAAPAVVVVGSGGGPVIAVLADTLGQLSTADGPGRQGVPDNNSRAWALGETGAETMAVVAVASPADLVDRLRSAVDFLAPGLGPRPVRLGVSDAVPGGPGLLAAVAQARAALAAVGGDGGASAVAGPDRLSSHEALIAAVPAELRRAYRDRVLGPLLAHDRVHRTELVRTLAAYLDCSGSWSRCAVQMHLHVNTLRYRIEKIEALTGRNLRHLPDQVDLLVALNAQS
jgi:hypothetical protein